MKILALLLQEMISISINDCFQILLIFSLFIMLLYTCNRAYLAVLFTQVSDTTHSYKGYKKSGKLIDFL